jgi:hypothetical protein
LYTFFMLRCLLDNPDEYTLPAATHTVPRTSRGDGNAIGHQIGFGLVQKYNPTRRFAVPAA